jgi:electron-transferring-flavoprotein dehydrogenase
MEREIQEFDVLIVGGGPAGLSAAIRLKQLAAENNKDLSVCLIDKGAEIGAHILSGAVMDPKALTELIPDWKERGAPLDTPVTEDRFLFLTKKISVRCPSFLLPDCFKNHGNYIVSLGQVCRWLAGQAELLGVEIYPGFAASDVVYDSQGRVKGVFTGDLGVGRDGLPTSQYQPGMELHARFTLFAEGCRGHLAKRLEERFGLRGDSNPQVYGLGLKEFWEVSPEHHVPGLVMHTAGWPLENDTYGGSFCYHLEGNRVAIGFVVGLGYKNPYLSPYEEFQRYKSHPAIRDMLVGGKRLAYGARAITAGGLQSLPRLTFPGGALIGDNAGFLNAARIKGSHAAIKTGMLGAEAAFKAYFDNEELDNYPEEFRRSWLYKELHQTRNFKPYMAKGLINGTICFGFEQTFFKGKVPWTLKNESDHEKLKPAAISNPINYPKPDGVVSFDRLSSVFLSNTNHVENQPCHLKLRNPNVAIEINLGKYASPEQRYCPAGVYEIIYSESGERLQINSQNCIHCKTCDIKDPTQNIDWISPRGGDGPIYQAM